MDRSGETWNGIANYQYILSDPQFWRSLLFTLRYLLFVTIMEVVLGTLLALAIENRVHKDLWRGILIAPMLIVPVTTGVIWKLMFHQTVGIVNYLLSIIRIPSVEWLTDPTASFFAVSIMDIWQWTPFILLIVLSTIDVIPKEMYEAAKIDGASSFKSFIYITLPWLKNTLIFAFAIRSLEVLKVFDHIFSSTNGGPGYATEHISLYLYRIGFKFLKLNLASSGAIVITFFILVLWTVVYFGLMRKESEYV